MLYRDVGRVYIASPHPGTMRLRGTKAHMTIIVDIIDTQLPCKPIPHQ